MKLLLLSFYYPPDLSAGSFRMQGLIAAFERARAAGEPLEIDLVTTQPNRYANLAREAAAFEDKGWLRIHRLPLPPHQSGMRDQARSFLSYARGVRRLTARNRGWDAVFATSSRLMTAVTGARTARRLGLPLYLDIRDLFTDTMGDLLRGSRARHLLPLFDRMERRSFRQARRINVVSEGFLDHIRRIAPGADCATFTNGIADVFLETDFTPDAPRAVPRVLYAGNIGEGQGLHHVIPGAAAALKGMAEIRVVGGGGRAEALRSALAAHPDATVEMLPPVPRERLLEEYRAADILMLHLNDHRAFHRVLPSKIFEYAATGRPIAAGVAGFAAEFLRREVPHAHVSAPCDAAGLADAIRAAAAGPRTVDRAAFRATFAQAAIMDRLAADILGMGRAA